MSVWIGLCPPSTLLQPLACALLRFTPDLALASESVILMDVTASLRLFGGIRQLRAQVRRVLGAFDARETVSVAASWAAAWVLARSGRGGSALTPRSLQRALAQVPLSVAPPARPFADWFRDLGCDTLADLQRLPRVGLKKRCGPALLDWLDQLSLGSERDAANGGLMPYPWLELPPEFDAMVELPDHIEHAPALQWAVQRLILQLCGWLAARQQDVTAFTVLLMHERRAPQAVPVALPVHGRRPGPATDRLPVDGPTALPIILGAPAHEPAILTRLVQEHLTRLTLPASVIAVRLQATRFQAMRAPSLELFPDPGGTPQDHAQLLALLGARLGADNLLVPAPVADHRPERAARWMPLDQASPRLAVGQTCTAAPFAPLPRPAWLLDEPVPLAVQGHRPFYGTPLRLVSPAERLDCGWQDGCPVTRDYFVAEDETGICYWIFRAAPHATAGPSPQWFLHGLFG